MGRRRARPVATATPGPTGPRTGPVGGARVAWSYLAAMLAALIGVLGLTITDAVQSGMCGAEDVSCALGTYVAGGVLSGVVGVSVAAALLRLGWEWWLICVTALVAMPALLDIAGGLAWGVLAVAPLVAACVTLTGSRRPRWRPVVIGGVCVALLAWTLLWTFFPPGG